MAANICVYGIDLGGTNLRVALVDADGNILKSVSTTMDCSSPEELVNKIADLSAQISSYANDKEIKGVGIGCPGIIDHDNGVIIESPNIKFFNETPLVEMLSNKLNLPVAIENDANAAALGEYWLGAGQGAKSLLCVTVGTGVGGGIVLNGQIWHGISGNAGEIGHVVIIPDGEECGCGNKGCLEAYSSATGIVQSAQNALIFGTEESMLESICSGDTDNLTAEMVFEACFRSDRIAMNIMREAGKKLGIAIADALNLFNFEFIIISGGVSKAGNFFLGPMKDEIKQRTFERPFNACSILNSTLGGNAGIFGASKSIIDKLI